MDTAGKIVLYSHYFAKMWRLPESFLKSKDDNQALSFVLGQLKDPESFLTKVNKLYADPTAKSFDTLEFKDGRIFERHSSPHMLNDEVIGRVWSFRDVTARVRAEQELKQSESRLRNVLETLELIAVSLDKEGNITFCNDYLLCLTGWRRKEVLGKNWFTTFLPPDIGSEIKESVFLKAIRTGKFPAHYQNDIITKEKARRLIHWNNTVVRDFQGNIFGITSIGEDITERKQAEEALRESEEKYRDLVESINDVIYAVDTKGIVTYVSPVIETQMGYSPFDIIGKYFSEFVHHEDRPFVMNQFQRVLSGEMMPSQYRLIKKSGETLWIRSSSRPVFKGDNILGIILGNIELALDDIPEWNPARFNLEEIRIAGLRAKDVVRQLLSFARKTKLEKKPTNIIPIVKESIKLLRSSIPSSIDIRQNIPEDVDTILADPTQINQVLINLCTNADHAMPKMSGDKLVKEILKIRQDTPIIICTVFSEKMDGEKARALGASGYLEKPHEKRDLAKMVRNVLDQINS